MDEKKFRLVKAVAFPLLIAAIVALALAFWKPIAAFFDTPEKVKAWVYGTGWIAPFAYMLIQLVQVIVFVIPGEVVQIAGGYLFGPVLGALYSIIGITAGSVVNFVLGRFLGIPFIESIFGKDKVAKFEKLTSSARAQIGFFLLFVIPGIPKDILCYIAGISSMKLSWFFAVSMIGRLPGIIGSTVIGSSAAERNWGMTIAVMAVAVVLFVVGSIFQDRVRALAERLTGRKGKAPFIKGADVSTLQQIEDFGGAYYDGGKKRDLLGILKDRGFDYVRLKVWNNPGLPDSDPAGYNDAAHVGATAKRAKDAGFGILIDFHYSDFWADPGKQIKPAAWAGLGFEELKQAVYEYTKDTVSSLIKAGARPDIVQIGNEVTNGMLWDEGRIYFPDGREDWSGFIELLKSGLGGLAAANHGALKAANGDASKAADRDAPRIRSMLHIDKGGDLAASERFLEKVIEAGVEFDSIGQSYYPAWHGSMEAFRTTMTSLARRFGKDLIVAETAYPWTTETDGGLPAKTAKGLDGYPISPEGQAKFLREVLSIVRGLPNGRGRGVFYWEPGFITVKGCGWKYGEGNEWSNMTLFDFKGEVLSSMDAFKE